ncbi:MAG: hypothetical protein V4550_11005 [Gemmatimonadota bacterium]
MRSNKAKRLARLRFIALFLDQHADELPGVNSNVARRRLDELIDMLNEHAIAHEGTKTARRAETQRYQELRRQLVQNHMAHLVAVAQSVLMRDPGVRVFQMPRGNPHPLRLASIAKGLAEVAEAHTSEFIAAGIRKDFAAQLREAADAMLKSHDDREAERLHAAGALSGIDHRLRDAKSIVRVLGVLVRNEAQHQPALLASWHAVATPGRIARVAVSQGALPAGAPKAALSAPKMKLLASGAEPAAEPPTSDAGPMANLLAPLSRLFGAS